MVYFFQQNLILSKSVKQFLRKMLVQEKKGRNVEEIWMKILSVGVGFGYFFIFKEQLLVFVIGLIKNGYDNIKILKSCKNCVVYYNYIAIGIVVFERLYGF